LPLSAPADPASKSPIVTSAVSSGDFGPRRSSGSGAEVEESRPYGHFPRPRDPDAGGFYFAVAALIQLFAAVYLALDVRLGWIVSLGLLCMAWVLGRRALKMLRGVPTSDF
jgi:hypothetical protein